MRRKSARTVQATHVVLDEFPEDPMGALKASLAVKQAEYEAEASKYSVMNRAANEQQEKAHTIHRDIEKTETEIQRLRNDRLLLALQRDPLLLDILVPQHALKSCPKEDNSSRCARCFLEYGLKYGYIDGSWSFEVKAPEDR